MQNRELVSSLFWIILAVVFCIAALDIGIISPPGVGPGCLPFIVGIALIFLSLINLIPHLFNRMGQSKPAKKEKFFPERDSARKLLISLLALFAYGTMLELFGYLITTTSFLVFVLRWVEPRRWRSVFIFAILITLLSFTLFRALKVELPRGLMGI